LITDRTKSIIEKYHPGTLPLVPDTLKQAGLFVSVPAGKKWMREQGVSLFEKKVSLSEVSFSNGSTVRIPQGILFRKKGQRGQSSKALTWRNSEDKILADLGRIYPDDTIKLEATGNAIAPNPKAVEAPAVNPVSNPVTETVEAHELEPIKVADKPSEKRPLTVSERLARPATPEQRELAENACAGSWWDAPGLIRQLQIQPKTVYCPERNPKGCPVQFRLCGQCQHHESCNMYLLGLSLQP